jgi:hypothetical protein
VNSRNIKSVCRKTINRLADSFPEGPVREAVLQHAVITGGAIASMLLGEPVNDFDIYFDDRQSCVEVASWLLAQWSNTHLRNAPILSVDQDRVRIVFAGRAGVAGEPEPDVDDEEVPFPFDPRDPAAKPEPDKTEKPTYRPVFITENAISLSGKIQIIVRFFGEPDEIHRNFDFVHCCNHYRASNGELVLWPAALESLLAKELRFCGSRYPVCSLFRLRKFIERGWKISAGEVLKIALCCQNFDLRDVTVLQEQLIGVDSAYFRQLLERLADETPDGQNISELRLIELIDLVFG